MRALCLNPVFIQITVTTSGE